MTLTVEQIQQMAAGRELDALVAEHVMGWRTPKGYMAGPWTLQPPDEDEAVTRVVPSYSTDIAAAWEVVRKLTAFPFRVVIRCTEAGLFDITISCGVLDAYEVYAEVTDEPSFPLAVCRAALIALAPSEVRP